MLDCIRSYIGNLTVSEQVRARVEDKEKKICFHPVGNTTVLLPYTMQQVNL